MKKLPLHEPNLLAEDEKLILEVMRSSWVSCASPIVAEFEAKFREQTGVKHALALQSGTAALQLIVEVTAKLAGIQGAYEVLVPTLTFIATANAVSLAGGTPRLLDCGVDNLNVPANFIEEKVRREYQYDAKAKRWISKKSGLPLLALLAVHVMGWATDPKALKGICDELGIAFLEDAAEAVGCTASSGESIGTSGLAAAFSFNANKVVTTGSGGMLVTNDSRFHSIAEHLSTTAKVDAIRYTHDQIGRNLKMPALSAAMGLAQLNRLEATLVSKRRVHATYAKRLTEIGLTLHGERGGQSNYWLNNVLFPNAAEHDQALQHLLDNNVECRPLWTPIHLQPAYRHLREVGASFPNAEAFHARMLSLPSGPKLTDEQIGRVVTLIAESRRLRAQA